MENRASPSPRWACLIAATNRAISFIESAGFNHRAARSGKRIRSREIGIVFQDTRSTLNPALTVLDHLVETLQAHQTLSKREASARALELLQEVGFRESEAKLHPFELSGGMCQRLGIALGICNSPQLLVADEPTSAMDSAIQMQILDLLQRMKQHYSLAILLISHDLPLISKVSDRISVIYHGRIVESGLTEEVLTAPAHPYTRNLLQCQPSFLNHHEENPLAVSPWIGFHTPARNFLDALFLRAASGRSRPARNRVPAACAFSSTHVVSCIHGTGRWSARAHNF